MQWAKTTDENTPRKLDIDYTLQQLKERIDEFFNHRENFSKMTFKASSIEHVLEKSGGADIVEQLKTKYKLTYLVSEGNSLVVIEKRGGKD